MQLKAKSRRKVYLLLALVVVIAVSVGVWFYLRSSDGGKIDLPTVDESQQINQKPNPAEIRIKVAAMGDMLAHDSVNLNAKTAGGGYDYAPYFANIAPLYSDADIVFCNQEGLSSGEKFGISGYPTFNAPTEFADGLKNGAGCNVINLANNHIADKGTAAINATLDYWDKLGALAVAGANRSDAEQRTVKYFDVKGIKFAFLAFADYSNNGSIAAYALNNYHSGTLMQDLVTEAREKADVVLVSMHWGTEDSSTVNSDQKQQIAKLSSLGVDVVIGTGPHVLQRAEWANRPDDRQMLVWYSIGNMLSTQLKLDELTGCIAKFEIVKAKDSPVKIENPTCTPTLMSYSWTASEKQQGDILKRRDLQLKPLKDSAENLTKLHFSDSVDSRFDYVKAILGDIVTIVP
jgi:poly-gamma-glutamate synthesis protein (capsule biosynthesis protein)